MVKPPPCHGGYIGSNPFKTANFKITSGAFVLSSLVEGKAFAVLAGAKERWLQPSSIDPTFFYGAFVVKVGIPLCESGSLGSIPKRHPNLSLINLYSIYFRR